MSWIDKIVPTVDDLPEASCGSFYIEKHTVTEADADVGRLYSFNPNSMGRYTPAGTYTGLKQGSTLWMSDTPDERCDHVEPVQRAKGTCLVGGLGIGLVVNAMLLKPEVERVIVVEIQKEVIHLVAPHYYKKFGEERLDVIHADVLEWKPPRDVRFEVCWWDIWANICSDNLPEMTKLHRRFGRHAEWQGSWSREMCLDARRRGW